LDKILVFRQTHLRGLSGNGFSEAKSITWQARLA